jgi:hypothetical protein
MESEKSWREKVPKVWAPQNNTCIEYCAMENFGGKINLWYEVGCSFLGNFPLFVLNYRLLCCQEIAFSRSKNILIATAFTIHSGFTWCKTLEWKLFKTKEITGGGLEVLEPILRRGRDQCRTTTLKCSTYFTHRFHPQKSQYLNEYVCAGPASIFCVKNPCIKSADLHPRQGYLLQRNIFR